MRQWSFCLGTDEAGGAVELERVAETIEGWFVNFHGLPETGLRPERWTEQCAWTRTHASARIIVNVTKAA